MRISDWSSDVFSSDLISVREIDAGNAQALYVCLYIATMFILGLPLKAALYFYRVFAASQDSDAVEALLPMPDAAIADVANVLFRKCLIGRLEFLQADDVGLRLRQPFQQEIGRAHVRTPVTNTNPVCRFL